MAVDAEEEFNSVVWDAAGGDDIDQLIQALTTHGHLIDTPHPSDKRITPLHRAAEQGNVAAIETLIRFGSQALNSNEWTPLHSAADSGHARAIEALLRLGCTTKRTRPLELAAAKGHVDAIKTLFCFANDIPFPTEAAMELAAQHGHVAAIEVIGRYDPESVDEMFDEVPPIFTAISNGHLEAVRAFIRLGTKEIGSLVDTCFYWTDSSGYTPLQVAAEEGRFEIVRLLIRYGSLEVLHDRDKSQFWTPLGYAINNGHLEVARFLKSLYTRPLEPAKLEDDDDSFSDDENDDDRAPEDITLTEDEVIFNRYLAFFAYSLSEQLFFELECLPNLTAVPRMGDVAAHLDFID